MEDRINMNTNKNKYIKVRLTEQEYIKFKSFCLKNGLNLSVLIRQLLKTWVYSNASTTLDN